MTGAPDTALESCTHRGFIRKDKAIPFGKPVKNTSEIDLSALKLIGYAGCHYELYSDDGFSPVPEDSLKNGSSLESVGRKEQKL